MKGKTLRVLYYFLLLASLAFKPSSCSSTLSIGKKYFVRIVNDLDNKPLDFSCKSGDDQINRSLPNAGSNFEFGFRLGFTTQFNCDLRYSTYHAMIIAFRDDEALLNDCGGVHCIWSAREDGIYLYRIKHDDYKKWYDWEKQIQT
ncbi:unnamed protein product [Prunus armeniaca]|uniref:S-protein homolog n=1 Tax=Prunus armeniaca TaxID=36596 RepID=A0A6J5VU99_PRUAR|nr:unnamed protein product [Prunus armeniaca]